MSVDRVVTGFSASPARILAAILAIYIGAVCLVQLTYIADPSYLHEQQRSLFPYYRIADPTLFPDDYVTRAVTAFSHPFLYDWTTRLWVWAGGDLILLHRLLPLACWLAFLAGMAAAARKLGDTVTVLGTLGLAAALPLYLNQIAGASPHAFAFPLLIWGVVALLHGSTRGLALVTVLSGLLYVGMAPVLGLFLAWQVLVMGRFWRLANAERVKSLLLLAAIGGLSLWLIVNAMGATQDLGAPLEPMQQVDLYPENGPEGAYFFGVFNPVLYVVGKALRQFRTSEVMLAFAVLLLCTFSALYGLLTLPKDGGARKAMAGVVLCSLAAGLAVYFVKSYHTYRFILYPIFVFVPLLTVVGLQQLCRSLPLVAPFANAAAIVLLAPLLLAFDSFEPEKLGYRTHFEAEDQALIDFAAAQPPETLFAVWPGGEDVELDFIPYLARRPIFVMVRAHFPSYDRHTLTMRERMNALIDAYLATEAAPLRRLNCRWGVDYLIVDSAHFAEGGERPEYFAPFNARIEQLWAAHDPRDFLLAEPAPAAVALDSGHYRVIDLTAFSGGHCGAAQASQAAQPD